MKKDYTIDWQTNTITMSKKFAEEANHFGTSAYDLLMDVRSKGFDIVVRKREKRRACPTRVTYKQMENHLSCLNNPDERLQQLHAVMAAAKGQKNHYEYVRKWFLENYPNFRDIPVMDTNFCIVAPRVSMLPDETEPLKITA